MIRHDLSHWPLVINIVQGSSSLAEIEAYYQAWSTWLARGEPFATLSLFADASAMVYPSGASVLAKHWLQAHSAAIRAQMLGMVTVVPASEYARISKMNAEKLFGVPAAAFTEIPAALHWLHERVYAPRGLRFDADTVAGIMPGQ